MFKYLFILLLSSSSAASFFYDTIYLKIEVDTTNFKDGQNIKSICKVLDERIYNAPFCKGEIDCNSPNIIEIVMETNDSQRAIKLIKQMGELELSLLLDKNLENNISIVEDYLKSTPTLTSYFNEKLMNYGILGVNAVNIDAVKLLLSKLESKTSSFRGGRFVWSNKIESMTFEDSSSINYRELYFVSSHPIVTGNVIEKSDAKIIPRGSQKSDEWAVALSMNRRGAKKWSSFTGSNIGNRVAIIFNNEVYMTPVINDKIPSGQVSISGFENAEEAKDISNILKSGKLIAPINIVDEKIEKRRSFLKILFP